MLPGKTLRYSKQRERLLELLRSSRNHPTASGLYDRLKADFSRLSLGTVYRNLSILMEQGLVKKIDSGSAFDRYEADTTPHYHLICQQCGNIIDFPELHLPEINVTINRKTGFEIHHYRFDFFGICHECEIKSKDSA
jgi:Fur family peroxide stress response transcriptional regulator